MPTPDLGGFQQGLHGQSCLKHSVGNAGEIASQNLRGLDSTPKSALDQEGWLTPAPGKSQAQQRQHRAERSPRANRLPLSLRRSRGYG